MNNETLRQMRAANPVSAPELRRDIADEELDRAMRRAIEAEAGAPRSMVAGTRAANRFLAKPSRRSFFATHRGPTLGFSAGLASVGIIAAWFLFAGGLVGGGSQSAFAAAAIKVAEANPRLLVSAPGWSVSEADEFEANEGEIRFSDGSHELRITWYPARLYRSYRSDRADVGAVVTSTLLGHRATTVHYGGDDYATMLSPQGPVFVEVRGAVGSHAKYEEILHSLRAVDIDTWLNAMPASVVRPEAHAAAVEQMLRGIPLPPGFDVAALQNETSVRDRYMLGADVTSAVSCDWLERWAAATDGGDEAAARASVEAMATSRQWPILRQMAHEGAWAQTIWSYTREIQHGHLNRGIAAEFSKGGKTWAYGPAYATALDCKSQYRRLVDR